jgi:DNA-binding transcriptional regulator YiaG
MVKKPKNKQLTMNLMENIFLLERIDYLIRTKSAGAPKDFARRLGISVRTLHRYLSECNIIK